MKVSQQDQGKVIALVAGVIVVFALLIWRIMAASAPDNGQAQEVKLDTVPTASTTGSGASGASTLPTTAIEVTPPANAASIDPFRVVLATNPVSSGSSQAPVVRRSTGAGSTEIQGSLPPGVNPIVPNVSGNVPSEEPRLSGVMGGRRPMGVFLIAGREEILSVGEKTSNGFVVKSIVGDSAVLSKGKTTLQLHVGPGV